MQAFAPTRGRSSCQHTRYSVLGEPTGESVIAIILIEWKRPPVTGSTARNREPQSRRRWRTPRIRRRGRRRSAHRCRTVLWPAARTAKAGRIRTGGIWRHRTVTGHGHRSLPIRFTRCCWSVVKFPIGRSLSDPTDGQGADPRLPRRMVRGRLRSGRTASHHHRNIPHLSRDNS